MTTQEAPPKVARPRPDPSEISRPYFEGAKQHKLMVQRNKRTGAYLFYSHYFDPADPDAELEWVEASGKGKIYSFTIVRQHPHPFFTERLPYAYAIIELDEGVRMISNVITDDVEALRCDMPVVVDFEDIDDEIAVSVFRLAS